MNSGLSWIEEVASEKLLRCMSTDLEITEHRTQKARLFWSCNEKGNRLLQEIIQGKINGGSKYWNEKNLLVEQP